MTLAALVGAHRTAHDSDCQQFRKLNRHNVRHLHPWPTGPLSGRANVGTRIHPVAVSFLLSTN